MPVVDLEAALRTELVCFVRASGPRRVVPPVFHVGRPGTRRAADQVSVADDPNFGSGLRADLVERCLALLVDTIAPVPWLTRGGDLAVRDVDLAWAAAAREAFGRHDLAYPGLVVVTRHGWLRPESGARTEQKVRRRRRT